MRATKLIVVVNADIASDAKSWLLFVTSIVSLHSRFYLQSICTLFINITLNVSVVDHYAVSNNYR